MWRYNIWKKIMEEIDGINIIRTYYWGFLCSDRQDGRKKTELDKIYADALFDIYYCHRDMLLYIM